LRRQLSSGAGGWPEGLELDDDLGRIDLDAVHDYLSNESYWARGEEPYRGMGLGVERVKEAVENGPHADLRWWLVTADAHGLYAQFGFANPDSRYLTRPPNYPGLNTMQKDTHGRASNQTPADEAIDSDRHP
jgi:hypothetical protein